MCKTCAGFECEYMFQFLIGMVLIRKSIDLKKERLEQCVSIPYRYGTDTCEIYQDMNYKKSFNSL